MMFWGMLSLQDGLSLIAEEMLYFHDYLMMVVLMILLMVGYFLISVLFFYSYTSSIVADHVVESVWTVLPMVVLVFLIYPSVYLLYLVDEESVDFLCTLKIVGHQWYWSYKMDGLLWYEFDSYMDSESLIRMIDVDNRVVVPSKEYIRVLVTSSDVLHSWALPSLGVKMDAIPGRLNQFMFMIMINSVIYGQCSEICGVNHSFMPIVLESVDLKDLL